jgi:hypothetical protein
MTYRFTVSGPLAATDGSPVGAREYWGDNGRLARPRVYVAYLARCRALTQISVRMLLVPAARQIPSFYWADPGTPSTPSG